MVDFTRSSFTWHAHPWKPDPYYRWPGGFVGEHGESYHVRFTLEGRCQVTEDSSGVSSELFLGAPCRSEYTIAKRNLFQIPGGEWRLVFSRHATPTIAARPSAESEFCSSRPLDEIYQDHAIDIRTFDEVEEITDVGRVVEATLDNDILSARSTYKDERGFTVEVEYPVNVMNLNAAGGQFQVCTGPIVLPDLATWTGAEVERVFIAHVAISDFDFVEFILRQEVDAAPEVRAWLDQPRGRDRLKLTNPNNKPEGYPPDRAKPYVYNETWELGATNAVLRAPNP